MGDNNNNANNNVSSNKMTESPSVTNSTPSSQTLGSKQMQKMRDANTKYKNLLKMARERIQAQEEELERLRDEMEQERKKIQSSSADASGNNNHSSDSSGSELTLYSHDYHLPVTAQSSADMGEGAISIVRVLRCLNIENHIMNEDDDDILPDMDADDQQTSHIHGNENNNNSNHSSSSSAKNPRHNPSFQNDNELWAYIEYERPDPNAAGDPTALFSAPPTERFRRWRCFPNNTALSDHTRRSTGEPILIPPPSLSAEQSEHVRKEAQQAISHITEEYRRFRVRAEVARKQTDATVRSLQNSNVSKAKQRIEGEDIASELDRAREDHLKVNSLMAEMAEQEAHWKGAYDSLLAENETLRSSGSEALLAAQWRKRYETCLREKEDLDLKLGIETEKLEKALDRSRKDDVGKYEARYKDLKESFRLYRKKAKEIFEAQQNGDAAILNLSTSGSEEAKFQYLRNLMVNYLSSDPAVREHMEDAIATVLKFTAKDKEKIKKQKNDTDTWFGN